MQHTPKLKENRLQRYSTERLVMEPHRDKQLIPTWLKTFTFLGAAGAASLIVAASLFTLSQQDFPLLHGFLSW